MGRKSKDNPADDVVVEETTANEAVETTGSGESLSDSVVDSQTVELPETVAAIAEQSAVEDRPEPVEIFDVVLRREAALGEGTRPAGTLMAYIGLPPGVTLNEALAAIRNPQLIKL